MRARTLRYLGSVALMLFTVGRAGAQPSDDATRAEARKIGYSGVEAYQAGDFATAHDRLETAYQLLRVPSLGLWSARALAKVGKLVEADARYLEVIRLPTSVGDEAIQEQARRDATSERADLGGASRSSSYVSRALQPARWWSRSTAHAARSTARREHPVNPGRHKVEGVRGSARATAEVVVAEGEKKEAVLRLGGPAGRPAGTSGSADSALARRPAPFRPEAARRAQWGGRPSPGEAQDWLSAWSPA